MSCLSAPDAGAKIPDTGTRTPGVCTIISDAGTRIPGSGLNM